MRTLLHAVDHAWQALATHSQMNVNDVVALELLYFTGQVSTSQLRMRTGLSASAVTGLVDRLEDRELVRRTRPRHNRRLVLVELTDDGRGHAATLFSPLLSTLDRLATSGQAPPLTDQLPVIRHLISLFEHTAVQARPLATARENTQLPRIRTDERFRLDPRNAQNATLVLHGIAVA